MVLALIEILMLSLCSTISGKTVYSNGVYIVAYDLLRYMVEIQNFSDAEKAAKSILTEANNVPRLALRNYRNLLGLYERTGRSIKAYEAAKNEYDVFIKSDLPKDNNYANAHIDVGSTLVSSFRAAEALQHLDTAVSMATDVGNPETYTVYNIDRFLRNRARAKQLLGRLDDSLADLDQAEQYQIKIHGPKSHYEGK